MAKKSVLPVASTANEAYKLSADEEKRERHYRAKSALEDLERAEGHKVDKDLMRDVKSLAKDKIKNLGKVCGK